MERWKQKSRNSPPSKKFLGRTDDWRMHRPKAGMQIIIIFMIPATHSVLTHKEIFLSGITGMEDDGQDGRGFFLQSLLSHVRTRDEEHLFSHITESKEPLNVSYLFGKNSFAKQHSHQSLCLLPQETLIEQPETRKLHSLLAREDGDDDGGQREGTSHSRDDHEEEIAFFLLFSGKSGAKVSAPEVASDYTKSGHYILKGNERTERIWSSSHNPRVPLTQSMSVMIGSTKMTGLHRRRWRWDFWYRIRVLLHES